MQELQVNINGLSLEEKQSREKSLRLFNANGFPNKRQEDWKFTDLSKIIADNFSRLKPVKLGNKHKDIEQIKDLKHNSIFLVDGFLKSFNFEFENLKNIKIKEYKNGLIKKNETSNSLINLNDALSIGGFFLEISSDYKLKKPLIVYNIFSDSLDEEIINNKNLIILQKNSNLEMIEYNINESKKKFIQNNYTEIEIGENSSFKNYTLQACNSNGFFYKFIKGTLNKNSNYEDCIFSSGLKFNKIDEDIDIVGENANCTILSALFLDKYSHQEIKTNLNHLQPNCKSYQKIKNVLSKNSKSIYQGKIFVKDIAQKTDAYQLSKALLLDDTSEFNAKPELEIYADDVKCSHGSTSGNINEDSIYYLMTRGITRKKAISLLTKAFLLEITSTIANIDIKKFIEKNLERQVYEY
jgi:Fe-S cluster assembly protein SufD